MAEKDSHKVEVRICEEGRCDGGRWEEEMWKEGRTGD